MLVILRVMPSEKGEGSFAKISMNVFHLRRGGVLAHDYHMVFDAVPVEAGSLSHETLDHWHVVLG